MTTNVLVDGEILLYGDVGEDGFWGLEGFMAADVVRALAQLKGQPVTVRMNSGGGLADEGIAIYNSLRAHGQPIAVYVDAGCASAASFIAMAGDKVIMRAGTYMMIHEPVGMALGDAAVFDAETRSLNVQAENHASIYATKTKKPAADMRALMKAETWMTPEQAVANGFADEVSTENAIPIAAFDYTVYRNVPAPIAALAQAKDWKGQRARIIARKEELKMPPVNDPNPTPPAPPAPPQPVDHTAAIAAAMAAERQRSAEIMRLAGEHQVPAAVASEMIGNNATIAQATERFMAAGEIKKVIARANKICPTIALTEADAFIAANTPLVQVQAKMLEKIETVSASTGIDTNISGAPNDERPPAANPQLDKMIERVVAQTNSQVLRQPTRQPN